MKFGVGEFVIDKNYASELDSKLNIFREQAKTKKTIFPTMVTTYGTKHNIYFTGRIQAEVTMGDLFK